nr:integrase, catalytic region, zinc finger, CCHC-type, peptidase aspartic, catalytic [Tanacetum cinerariifolium]
MITVGSTMRILLLYRGEYSQWRERFMNYLEEQTDSEAMINSIQNGLPNYIYSLIDSNETAKDLWVAFERQMRGSEYGEQDRKAALQFCMSMRLSKLLKENSCLILIFVTYKIETVWYIDETTKNLIDINIDALYNILKQNQGDVNDALGYKKKAVVITLDPLALVAEKTKVSKRKEKVVASLDSEGSGADDFSELKNIIALLAKAFNRRKFYSKPTNNNLRTSSTSQSANKKQEFVKSDDKKVEKKDDEKKQDLSKVKCYNCKKEGHFEKTARKQSLKIKKFKRARENKIEFAYDYGNLNASYVNEKINFQDDYFQEIINPDFEKIDSPFHQISSLKPYVLTVILETIIIDLEDDVVSLLEKEKANLKTIEYLKSKGFESSENAISESENQSENDCQVVEKECRKVVNSKVIAPRMFKLSVSQSVSPILMSKTSCDSKNVENKTKRKRYTFSSVIRPKQSSVIWKKKLSSNTSNVDLSSVSHSKLNKDVKRYSRKDLLCDSFDENNLFIFDDESVRISPVSKMLFRKKPHDSMNTIHMIMHSKDTLYNGKKEIGFENPSYFEKAKDLRPGLYDEKVIGLGLKIEKFKRERENKIEFAYDYGNLNASYVNEKINFSDDYFQEIINPDFEKIDSPCQQTSSLKPYVLTVILETIIIDLEDDVVSLLEKEKENLKTIESLKSKGFESSENAISESENQSENDCQVVEKECRKVIVQICLWIIYSGCSKHMTGNRALLTNFIEKFLGTVHFGNNDFVVIAAYGDAVIRSMTIKKVYYVEGLGHNLFSVRQFCDNGLEVAFRKSTCFVRNEDSVDLLTGDRSSNLYTIVLNEVASNSSTCLLAKDFSSQSWLWHQHISHLNFV